MARSPFRFKRFLVEQEGAAHPVGTDGVLLGAWADVTGAQQILDIGTCTGLVALMLAQRTEHQPPALITGVELHERSFACALRNFRASPWNERLRAEHVAVQAYNPDPPARFDLIVSNPPFFTETIVSPDATRRLGRNTQTLSLSDLSTAVLRLLKPEGRFCAVLPVEEGRRFAEWCATLGLYSNRETVVYARPGKPAERLLLEFSRAPGAFTRSTLYIYQEQEIWSKDFRALTGLFYLG